MATPTAVPERTEFNYAKPLTEQVRSNTATPQEEIDSPANAAESATERELPKRPNDLNEREFPRETLSNWKEVAPRVGTAALF